MAKKPSPRVVTEVCSLCGLDWKRHGTVPTSDKCVELLLAEVRSLNDQLASRPYAQPYPIYPVNPYPYRPWYGTFGNGWQTITVGSSTPGVFTSHSPTLTGISQQLNTSNSVTPTQGSSTPHPVKPA